MLLIQRIHQQKMHHLGFCTTFTAVAVFPLFPHRGLRIIKLIVKMNVRDDVFSALLYGAPLTCFKNIASPLKYSLLVMSKCLDAVDNKTD